MPTDDNPIERQPLFGYPNRNNRIYVPAEWAASGTWTGSPKISGGIEVSKGTSVEAPRGLNRPDQRYELSISEAQARREARGADEYPYMFFLITELDRFEVQTKSGKSVDAVPLASQVFTGADGELHMCQCEDDWRLRQSGYVFTTVCKHVVALRLWLLDTTVDERFYSLEYVSEQTGFSLRALEAACKEDILPATKIGRQWGIDPGDIGDVVSGLNSKKITFPNSWPFS